MCKPQSKSWQSLYAFVQLRCEFEAHDDGDDDDSAAIAKTKWKCNEIYYGFFYLLLARYDPEHVDVDDSTSCFMWAHELHALFFFFAIPLSFSISNTIHILKSFDIRF